MSDRKEFSGFAVRLPLELRRWLGIEAAKQMRSLNAEIVMRLMASKAESERTAHGSRAVEHA